MSKVDYYPKVLHISDIEKRLKKNPEPDEIKEIRERLTSTFSNLRFEEEAHKYFVNDNGTEVELKSVSATIHQFEPVVDWDSIAQKKAEKEGIPLEVLKKSWTVNSRISTSNGSLTHLYGESLMLFCMGEFDKAMEMTPLHFEDGYLIPYGPKEMAISKYWYDLMQIDCIYPIIPELRMYYTDTKQKFAGTADILLGIKQKDGIRLLVHDYKSNHTLQNSYNRKFGRMLEYPFGDLYNEPQSLYTLQSACYGLPLQKLGYEVVDRRLIHVLDTGEYDKVKLPDYTNRMIEALNM